MHHQPYSTGYPNPIPDIVVESDNVYCYDHDIHRLFVSAKQLFHEKYHCFALVGVDLNDDAFMKHVFNLVGHVSETWSAISRLESNCGKSLSHEHSRSEMLFRSYSQAEDAVNTRFLPFKSRNKFAFLRRIFTNHHKINVTITAIASNAGYDRAAEVLFQCDYYYPSEVCDHILSYNVK